MMTLYSHFYDRGSVCLFQKIGKNYENFINEPSRIWYFGENGVNHVTSLIKLIGEIEQNGLVRFLFKSLDSW